jgi:hypothetical protein
MPKKDRPRGVVIVGLVFLLEPLISLSASSLMLGPPRIREYFLPASGKVLPATFERRFLPTVIAWALCVGVIVNMAIEQELKQYRKTHPPAGHTPRS